MLLFTGELELEVASPIESNGWTGKARSGAPTDILQRTKYILSWRSKFLSDRPEQDLVDVDIIPLAHGESDGD